MRLTGIFKFISESITTKVLVLAAAALNDATMLPPPLSLWFMGYLSMSCCCGPLGRFCWYFIKVISGHSTFRLAHIAYNRYTDFTMMLGIQHLAVSSSVNTNIIKIKLPRYLSALSDSIYIRSTHRYRNILRNTHLYIYIQSYLLRLCNTHIARKVLLVVIIVARARARSIEFILICSSFLQCGAGVLCFRDCDCRGETMHDPDQHAPSVRFSRSIIRKAPASWYIYDTKHNCVSVYIGFGCNIM